MAKNTFQLDLKGGREVLTKMARPMVFKSTQAIASRAARLAGINFKVSKAVGVNKKGERALGEISFSSTDKRDLFLATDALKKSIDAGRV